jgi:hypothetical protein
MVVPALELSHQVSRKVSVIKNGRIEQVTDMPPFRVKLLHRNTTYLFTRSARGLDRVRAAAWQLRKAFLHAVRFIRCGVDQRWGKAAAALLGWCLGLMALEHRHPYRAASE